MAHSQYADPRQHANALKGAIAGTVAGVGSRLVAAPFDLLKIRFQVQHAPLSSAAQTAAKYRTLWQAIPSIAAEEGLRGFWRGNIPATLLWGSYTGVQFACFRGLQAHWDPTFAREHVTLVSGVTGACAGVIATSATYPFDLFRTIFASQGVPKAFPTLTGLARHRLQTLGVRGMYTGQGIALFQIAPYAGMSFAIYTSLNALSRDAQGRPRTGVLSYAGHGAVAGLLSKLAVHPLDTIKKRMQMRGVVRDRAYGVIPKYRSSWQCACAIWTSEGVRGFYKGVVPSVVKSIVGHAATFAIYEVTIKGLDRFEDVLQLS